MSILRALTAGAVQTLPAPAPPLTTRLAKLARVILSTWLPGLTTETIEIDRSLTIQGAGNIQPGGTIIQGHQNSGEGGVVVLAHGSDTDLEISNLIIRNGFIGILSNAINSLELNEVTVRAIESSGASGAYGMYALSTSKTLNGGALYMVGVDNPVLANVTFSQNEAKLMGGALYMEAVENAVLTDVVFAENKTKGANEIRGGAVYSEDSSATYTNAQFNGNISERTSGAATGGYGGALYITGDGNTTFLDVAFSENEARSTFGGSGGAVYLGHGETQPVVIMGMIFTV